MSTHKKNRTQPIPHEIARTLVLSTGHIKRKDAHLLDQDIAPVVSFQKVAGQGTSHCEAFGYWVHVPNDRRDTGFATRTETIRRVGYSRAFVNLLKLARQLDCQWLMLDRDGPIRDDLPKFAW